MEVDSQYRRESAVRHLQPTRRELLQVGYSGLLGLGMSQAVSGRNQLASAAKVAATSSGNRPKQVVIVFLTGAASHHETFDMKPDATAKIRGDFNRSPRRSPVTASVSTCHTWPRGPTSTRSFARCLTRTTIT